MSGSSASELAATLGTTHEHLNDLLSRTLDRVPRRVYYVFRISNAQSAGRTATERLRMIAAFPSPDDALSFAQRNGYGSTAQIRSIAASDLLLRMLSDSSIGSVLFLDDHRGQAGRGFGPGLKVSRNELLDRLHQSEPSVKADTLKLTAQHFDALQFGVNFTRRAEFRAALAQAVEQVVQDYEPPIGSIDRGPRSIFATTAVEKWLKEHGFPHAYQRRWIDVADDPAWGGAVELCEIDGGTQNHLLVQLLIHADETGRQYIKRVNVTS